MLLASCQAFGQVGAEEQSHKTWSQRRDSSLPEKFCGHESPENKIYNGVKTIMNELRMEMRGLPLDRHD